MIIRNAMKTLIKRGMTDTKHNERKLLKQLKKDSKDPRWENGMRKTLDDEWMLRLCMANLMDSQYDWEGWGLRNPRDLLIPDCAPWWDGKRVKRLLVLGEQGLGDEILFASLFNEINADEITVECDKRLVPVFERNFPNIRFVGRKHYNRKFWGTDDSELESMEFDAQTLMGDLPTWYRRKKSAFPKESSYLKPNPELVRKYEWYKDCIGVSWIGRQGEVRDIASVENYPMETVVSLQYFNEHQDHEMYLQIPPFDLKEDIEDLFALVSLLKKVVSVPTTIVHIAGSLGVPVEIVMPKQGMDHGGEKVNNSLNWRFSYSGSDWHPNLKIVKRL